MTRTRLYVIGISALTLAIAGLVVAIPADQNLGDLLRLVLFHGAMTWANIVTFTLAGALALAFLITGRQGIWRWESGFRALSMPLWVFNTGTGVLSMYLTWHGFLWSEPRMRMTIWMLLAAVAVAAIGALLERPRLTATLDIGLAAALWTALALTPKVFHPDSPAMNSGFSISGLFMGLALASTLAAVLGAGLIASRTRSATA